MKRQSKVLSWSTAIAAIALVIGMPAISTAAAPKGKGARLSLPEPKVPENPPVAPTVITAGGQRLLLSATDVEVRYAPQGGLAGAQALVVNRPGWWVINFPLQRIGGLEGKSADEIARLLFGKQAAEVRNWYVKTPGEPATEPEAPVGPAPIEPTPQPTIIVDQRDQNADDKNPGTKAAPLKSIAAAVAKAKAGDIVHVYPGVYREAFKITENGTKERPIKIEGIRDENGKMPVISANEVFPPNAFQPVRGLTGVWRADVFTGQQGIVSANTQALVERSLPSELQPGEFCFNRGSDEFLKLRGDGNLKATGSAWKPVKVNAEGYLDFKAIYGERAKSAVFWASTWVWIPPADEKGQQWDPRFPEPIDSRVATDGRWRGFRMTGASLKSQVNKYRLWANGKLLPSCIRSQVFDDSAYRDNARFYRNYGFSDRIDSFPLQEGWNHLVFQFDTSFKPDDDLKFRFNKPEGAKIEYRTSAKKPADMAKPVGDAAAFITEYMVAGPYPGNRDNGVYVRLEGDQDPNGVEMDLAARPTQAVQIEGEYVQVRGFEIRHGAHFQQRGMMRVYGQGSMIEGCHLIESEFGGIDFVHMLEENGKIVAKMDQTSDPLIIRNNWIVNPGNVGIGGSATTELLTEENMNTTAPGRGRMIVEHNTIINPNWTGIAPFWNSGGMKIFKLTGCVVRYNTIIGGTGPSIWQDWEHYGNRLEGNLNKSGWAMLHGIEASPGPHIICNNLSVNLRPGEAWFRWALLSWSSGRNWTVNNTIDGRWNDTPAWQSKTGGDGINVGTGGDDRHTTWGSLPERTNAHINNLIVGCAQAINHRDDDVNEINVTDKGTGATHIDKVEFVDAEHDFYRLQDDSPLNVVGVKDDRYVDLVKQDFFGLLRFDEDGRTVGAFRAERESASPGAMVEFQTLDGTPHRLYRPQPAPSRFSYNVFQAEQVFDLPVVGKEWKDRAEWKTDEGAVWSLHALPFVKAFSPRIGASKRLWGPLAEYNAKDNRFDGSGAYLEWDQRTNGATVGAHGPNRPVLVFRAPAEGKYLFYAHPGHVSLWGAHTKMMLNLLHFAQGKGTGSSVYTFVTDREKHEVPVINEVVTMNAGDELALIVHSDGTSGSSGAMLSGYQIKVARFAR